METGKLESVGDIKVIVKGICAVLSEAEAVHGELCNRICALSAEVFEINLEWEISYGRLRKLGLTEDSLKGWSAYRDASGLALVDIARVATSMSDSADTLRHIQGMNSAALRLYEGAVLFHGQILQVLDSVKAVLSLLNPEPES